MLDRERANEHRGVTAPKGYTTQIDTHTQERLLPREPGAGIPARPAHRELPRIIRGISR